MLGDIAVLTAGTLPSGDLGRKLASGGISQRGRAKKGEVTKDGPTLIEGAGQKRENKGPGPPGRTQIAENRGLDGAVVADEVKQKPTNQGYDARGAKYCDMVKEGIIDPTKVVRSALQNAASIAGLMLTTEVLVTRTDEIGGGEKAKVEGSVR